MLSASEANHETKDIIQKYMTKELVEIESEIADAISRGRYHISRRGHLDESTKDTLKNLGYKVETGSQYNEMYYSIAWK